MKILEQVMFDYQRGPDTMAQLCFEATPIEAGGMSHYQNYQG
jgi:hypothetical protein